MQSGYSLKKITGSRKSRPELERMLDHLRTDDVVVVTKYDRLARSLKDLLDIVEQIKTKGAGFISLAENIDTTTPAGRLVFHVFGSIAEFERERISERTREGLKAARNVAVLVAGPLPFPRYKKKKPNACVMMKIDQSQK